MYLLLLSFIYILSEELEDINIILKNFFFICYFVVL